MEKIKVAGYVKMAKLWEKRKNDIIPYHKSYYSEMFADSDYFEFVGVYVDITGNKDIYKRKEMLRLIQDCMVGKVDCIVAMTKGYLAANMRDFSYLFKYLMDARNGKMRVKAKHSSYDMQAIENIERVFDAVYTGYKISFQYADCTYQKKRVLRKNGRHYKVNPYAIVYDKHTFYLICGMDEKEGLANYRVDRMSNVVITCERRTRATWYSGSNLEADLINDVAHSLNHFTGNRIMITLLVEKDCKTAFNILADEIGEAYYVVPCKDKPEYLYVKFEINYSPTVQNWLWEYADFFVPVAPEKVCSDYQERLNRYARKWEEISGLTYPKM